MLQSNEDMLQWLGKGSREDLSRVDVSNIVFSMTHSYTKYCQIMCLFICDLLFNYFSITKVVGEGWKIDMFMCFKQSDILYPRPNFSKGGL